MNGPAACDPDKKQAAHTGNNDAGGDADQNQHPEEDQRKGGSL